MDSVSCSRNSAENEKFLNSHLLVLNYVMDRTHPALSHQVDVVERLAECFSTVTVLTGVNNYKPTQGNISVISTDWVPGKNFRNTVRFYSHFFSVMKRRKFSSTFSHMTIIQSALIAPILRILQVRHFVWYAHAKNSTYLRWVHLWSNGILTSTIGSCPIHGKKVTYLGQSIDPNQFKEKQTNQFPLRKCVHIGRQDPSKNLDLLIQAVVNLRTRYPTMTLELIGDPLGPDSQMYLTNLKNTWKKELEEGWLVINPAIPRDLIPQTLERSDLFVHAFVGSLDKSLVEATMTRTPVVTLNQEYIREFGSWSKNNSSLESEFESLLNLTESELFEISRKRMVLARENHSLSKWVHKLATILKET